MTYKEYKEFNTSNDAYVELSDNGEKLTQEFNMPYGILDSISIQIGTFARDNNSSWNFYISEVDTGKIVYEDTFNASLIEDGGYYHQELKRRITVGKGKKYSYTIVAEDVNKISSLAFYKSSISKIDDALLFHNGTIINGTMCFKVYGGDIDYWWHGFVCVLILYIMAIVLRAFIVANKNQNCIDDKYFQGMIIGALTFILLCTFAINGSFTDENDNLRGGMVIANGGVLYKDYVTQHTPVTYYLCAVFAFFGAGSVEQFRLSYYFFEAIIWCWVYVRNVEVYGKKKMAILPIIETICIVSIINPYGFQILSDRLQGMMIVILLLECLRYYRDKNIGWSRSIILSICIWGSVGAAFVSVYALIWVALGVLVLEIINWKKQKVTIGIIVNRYYKFVLSLLVPFIITIIYFKINHSLKRAFDQFYTFNREVYPKYISGFGENISQPFIDGVQNFFNIVADNFYSLLTAKANNIVMLQVLIIVGVLMVLIELYHKRRYFEFFVLFLVMIFSATRGYDLHGLAAWYVALMIVAVYAELIQKVVPKIGRPVFGIASVILLSTYVTMVGNNLRRKQPSISELENQVIAMTEKDENQDIFLDAYCCDSLYFFYKDRKPINAAVYMLPWYMDWFEKDDICSLREYKPKVVVYNEDRVTWDYAHYTIAFEKELMNYYSRLGNVESGWRYSVWIRNDSYNLKNEN